MNCDDLSLRFCKEIYAALESSPEKVNELYEPEAKLIVSLDEEPQRSATSNYHEILMPGARTILRSNGQKNGDNIVGHCSGYIQKDEEYYQSNEMIVYFPKSDPETHDIKYKILFHSINLSKLDQPPPKPEPPASQPKPDAKEETPEQKQEPEPEKPPKPTGPIEVQASDLIFSRTVLSYNIPFSHKPTEILPEFEIYGQITRYAHIQGKILIEFQNPAVIDQIMRDGDFKWNGRWVKVKKMTKEFDI